MQPTSIQYSPVRDGRRVLGEKTANACLTPAHLRKASALAKVDSPVKGPLFEAPSPTKKLLPSPVLAGQKRTIEHLHDSVRPNRPSGDRRPHTAPLVEKMVERSNSPCTRRADDQVDRLPNYDTKHQEDVARSNNSDAHRDEAGNPTCLAEDAERRKVFIQTKANLLRHRIQNAMRHVKDLQLDRRLSDLEAHRRKLPRLSFSPAGAMTSPRDTVVDDTASLPLPKMHFPTLLPAANLTTTSPQLTVTPELSASDFETTPILVSTARVVSRGESAPLRVEARPAAAAVTEDVPTGSPMQLGTPLQPSSPVHTFTRCGAADVLDNHTNAGGCVNDKDTDGEQNHREDVVMRNLLPPSHRSDAVDGLLRLRKTAGDGVRSE